MKWKSSFKKWVQVFLYLKQKRTNIFGKLPTNSLQDTKIQYPALTPSKMSY